MKKTLFTLAGALLITANLSAQITLNQSAYNANNIGVDSLQQTAATSSFPNMAAATNATWDMSVVTDTTGLGIIRRVPTTYVGAQFADSIYNGFAGLIYNVNIESAITSAGLFEYGSAIRRQAFNIGSMTGTPTDSVIVDSQNIVYSSPQTVIAFPATYQSSWTSSYQYDFDFQLSLHVIPLSLSYDHAPGIVRAFYTIKDSVTGWGQMRVKDINGNPSGYMNVLQVQSTVSILDSFFINGAPASATLVAIFGQTQGGTTTTYNQYYYRPMELTPLAEVQYNDNTFSQPMYAQTHTQRLAAPTAVATVNNALDINVYPNPVTNHTISVDLPSAQNGNWTYDLINVTGQTVATAPISGSHTQVALSSTIVPGIYYLRVNKDSKQVCVKPLEIN